AQRWIAESESASGPDSGGPDAIEQIWVDELWRNVLGSGEESDEQPEDLGIHGGHFLGEVCAAGGSVLGVFGLGDGQDVGDEAEPLHAYQSLLAVGPEAGGVASAIEHQVTHDASVTHRDRQSLADDRVVVASGIADQHHTVGIRRLGPGVVAWVGRTGSRGRSRRYLFAPGVGRLRACSEESLGCLAT